MQTTEAENTGVQQAGGTLDFQTVSVFHFGHQEKNRPIESLKCEMDKHGDALNNSLLVTPEGFNVEGGYSEEGRLDDSVKAWLN